MIKIMTYCVNPYKLWLLHCLTVPPGTEVSLRCLDNGAPAGAGSKSELGSQAASRKAGYAGPGPRRLIAGRLDMQDLDRGAGASKG